MNLCDVVDSPVDLGENPACGSPSGRMVPPWVAEPYRLWSLLDIMQVIDPDFFSHLVSFCSLGGVFDGIQTTLDKLQVKDKKITDRSTKFMSLEEAEIRAEQFSRYGLPRSGDILKEWAGQQAISRHLPAEVIIPELRRSIERELRANLFLYVEENRRKYFEERDLFGKSVSEAFPSAMYDVEEAGKCYALTRYTSCVLHLMRVLEVGLDALKKPTGITSYSPTWKVAIDQIIKAISTKPEKDKTSEERNQDAFIRDAAHFLTGVKDAVRNPVTHKAATMYTEETALEVYLSVRLFMRHLAAKLSE